MGSRAGNDEGCQGRGLGALEGGDNEFRVPLIEFIFTTLIREVVFLIFKIFIYKELFFFLKNIWIK